MAKLALPTKLAAYDGNAEQVPEVESELLGVTCCFHPNSRQLFSHQ